MKTLSYYTWWQIFAVVLLTIVRNNKTEALPKFVNRIPNGDQIEGTQAAGHENEEGGGPLNSFGKDFRDGGLAWTKRLCELDSDHDGATNGEELGDPCCSGVSILSTRDRDFQPTHPGRRNNWSLITLSGLRCSNMSVQNFTLEVPVQREDSSSSHHSAGSTIDNNDSESIAAPESQKNEAFIQEKSVQASSSGRIVSFHMNAILTFLTFFYWMIVSL